MSAPATVYVNATVTDRDGQSETVYAGCLDDWAWNDPEHARAWKQSRRAMVLADRTTDPRGWRVTFTVDALEEGDAS